MLTVRHRAKRLASVRRFVFYVLSAFVKGLKFSQFVEKRFLVLTLGLYCDTIKNSENEGTFYILR